MNVLACGPYFDEGGAIASLVMLLVIKPLAYFAYVRAFRYRVSRAIPMRTGQAARLAALRTILGVLFVGGGAAALWAIGQSGAAYAMSWAYLYVTRCPVWWYIGRHCAGLRGRRLVGWIIGGMLVNAAFDGATVAGLAAGWVYPVGIVAVIAAFIAVLDAVGRRDRLKARFSGDPLCHNCLYNLTGNLSGICPECGTPIAIRALQEG